MTEFRNSISQALFGMIASAPSAIFAGLYLWQQGFAVVNVCYSGMLIIFSGLAGVMLWSLHCDGLDSRIKFHHQQNKKELNNLFAYTLELEKLLQAVTPKIGEQVAAARELTEKEIAVLIGQFSTMLDKLQPIIDFTRQDVRQPSAVITENLRSNAEKIRGEIDTVLESLQFQDRVSQILTQVGENLSHLKSTVDKIQAQGSERSQDMIKVDASLAYLQERYDSVNRMPKRLASGNPVEELTFF